MKNTELYDEELQTEEIKENKNETKLVKGRFFVFFCVFIFWKLKILNSTPIDVIYNYLV